MLFRSVAVVEFAPKKEGRSMTMVLGPVAKKGASKNKKAGSAEVKVGE